MNEGFDRARMKLTLDRDHGEALKEYADRLRAGVAALLKGTGFEIDYDHYGDQGVVLRHVHLGLNGGRIDVEIPLD